MTTRATLDGFHKEDVISMRANRSPASPLQLYAAFRRHHPRIVVPVDYVTECGFRLGLWQDRQRVARMLGTLPPQRIATSPRPEQTYFQLHQGNLL